MPFTFAGIQLAVGFSKEANLENAENKIREAVRSGADVICLPECFNSPYAVSLFKEYAEAIPDGPSTSLLSCLARELGVVIIGGSIPERDEEHVFNTSVVIGRDGDVLAKHRKVHLFDVDVPASATSPGITFKESDALSAGDSLTMVNTPLGKFGLAICYDLRFPQLSAAMSQDGTVICSGCDMLVFPAAFNTTTGPLHWELLLRARAVDNQVFVAAVSPARRPDATYQAWGHSSVVDPWGKVVATTGHEPDIIYARIDYDVAEEVRRNIPVRKQQRRDVYI